MGDVIPLAFEDNLVRAVERQGEPWFVGNDVCRAMSLANPRTSLERLDEDEKGVHTVDTPGGSQTVIIVSEAGVYRLVFTSRKPEAEKFKRWLAHDVLPALRKHGKYAVPGREALGVPQTLDDSPLSAATLKLSMVREARLIFGTRRAGELWAELGLPPVPLAPIDDMEEAHHCLRHILMEGADDDSGETVWDRLNRAIVHEDTTAAGLLSGIGIRVVADEADPGFVVANASEWLHRAFEGTPFAHGHHVYQLRRLPGARPYHPQRFGPWTQRGTFLPARYLDPGASGRPAP